ETTDTKVAASLQGALQVAIAVVVNITIADSSRAEKVTQELLEMSQFRQTNRQRLEIINSRTVDVTTTDTDVAISLQVMLQIRSETTDTKVSASIQGALQVAIAVVVNITIADSSRAEKVTQELLEMSQFRQTNRQRLEIINSRTVDVTTTDTDVAISLQVMLQI